jgi:hypothetical protein
LSTTSQPFRTRSACVTVCLGSIAPAIEVADYFGQREQRGNPIRLSEGTIQREHQMGYVPQRNLASNEASQERRAAFKSRDNLGCVFAAQWRYKCGRIAQIRAHFDFGDGDAGVSKHRISAFALLENLRQCVPQLFGYSKLSLAVAPLALHAALNLPRAVSFSEHEPKGL